MNRVEKIHEKNETSCFGLIDDARQGLDIVKSTLFELEAKILIPVSKTKSPSGYNAKEGINKVPWKYNIYQMRPL